MTGSRNYVQVAEDAIRAEIPDISPALLPLYTLLVLTAGPHVTRQHVHDAWSCWRNQDFPEHKSLIPYSELPPDIQDLDEKFTQILRRVAETALQR